MDDFTIHEDELELDRILLERNLQMQHTDTSFRLSSVGGEDESNELEYVRRNSAPSPAFAANFQERDAYADEGMHSPLHVWSYRTGEDEEGVHPYGGGSVSTPNHHASGVTFNAGLAVTRSRRGTDASLSGAEYDPERPIDAMIAGVEKLSMFNITEPSKSKHSNITFDPLVVDNTAELDRVLESGHQLPPSLRSRDKSASQHSRSVRLRSPPHSSATSSDEENNHINPDGPRPKLTDALRRVSFSPKRPRSPHSTPRASSSRLPAGNSPAHRRQPPSPLARVSPDMQEVPTPRPVRRATTQPTASSARATAQLQQAIPSSSTLAKSTRGKVGETRREGSGKARQRTSAEEDAGHQNEGLNWPSAPPVSRRVPNHRQATPLRKSMKIPAGTPRFGKVQLPDVTGLTSAVESPAKMGLADDNYKRLTGLRVDETTAREVEARLIKTLNDVHFRLEHLEEENSISRRRVRELEYELEECKREVVRERTRWQEESAELSGVIQAANLARALGKKSKGKARAKESAATAAANLSAAEERYRGAVEEKKALEALITSLRSHLTRLTSELSEHQAMLMELRSMREKDAVMLRDKLAEVDNLRNEVERLAGEVEVLRGVVEEGLRERRRPGRNVGVDVSVATDDHVISRDDSADHIAADDIGEDNDADSDMEVTHSDIYANTVANDEDPWSIDGSSRANATANPHNADAHQDSDTPAGISRPDRTIRTDRASLGSGESALGLSTNSDGPGPATRANAARAKANISIVEEGNSFVGDEERSRIEAEIGERRSLRGSFDASVVSISPRPKLTSPSFRPRRQAAVEDADSDRERGAGHLGRETRGRPRPATPTLYSQLPPRAPAPTPYHAAVGSDAAPIQQPLRTDSYRHGGKESSKAPETPFPQIRGEYLERLFFSAPEHDARTCTACNRRKMPSNAHVLKGQVHDRATGRCSDEEQNDDTIGQLLPSRYDRFLKSRKGKQWGTLPGEATSSGQRKDDPEGTDEGFADGSSEDGPALHGERKDKGKERAVGFEEVREMAKTAGESGLPPQTVVTRVIRELEDDFTHYKSIYCELADRYKEMDAASEVRRRNILAQHLKEVVDILEQKGDQIASLYDLLSFKDKLVTESAVPNKAGTWARNSLWSKRP